MSAAPTIVPFASRPVVSPAVACNLLSIGKTKFYELLAAGDLRSIKRGSRRYVFTDSLMALVTAWRDAGEQSC